MIIKSNKSPILIMSHAKPVRRVYAHGHLVYDDLCGYSKDKLLIWYDGKNNVSTGHSLSASYWHDLSGNGRHAQLIKIAEEGGWHQNCYEFRGNTQYFRINGFSLKTLQELSGMAFTVQIATERYNVPYTEYNTVLTTFDDRFSLYRSGNNYNVTWKGPSNRNTTGTNYQGGSVCATYSPDGTSMLYTDDMKSVDRRVSFWTEAITESAFVFGGADHAHFYSGKIYALRIYGRVLSHQEILKHHAIDALRFGLNK